MTETIFTRAPLTALLSTGQGNLLPNGSLWSHAAVLGTYVKDFEFTLDAASLENMVRTFTGGYPKKAPVDYEHEMFIDRAQRAGQSPWTIKAGDVVELRAVLSPADLLDPMRKQVADETARRERLGITEPVDPLGLWVRWVPTQRALALVSAREMTEMSIVFHPDYPNNTDGAGQGPTFLGVALTGTPFLDTMIPVAASRGAGGSPAAPGKETPMPDMKNLLIALSARLGRKVATEEEAESAVNETITTLTSEVTALKPHKVYSEMLAAELGEADPGKALAIVKTLKAQVAAATAATATAKKDAITAAVAACIKEHEAKLGSVAAREYFTQQLTAELETGQTIETAPTAALLKSMPVVTALEQRAGGDAGGGNLPKDAQISLRAKTLLREDPELKALASTDMNEARKRALTMAARELGGV